MANISDPSAVFVSTISKEHDIVMGSLYSIFCEFARPAQHCTTWHMGSSSSSVQARIPVVAECQAQLTPPIGPHRPTVPHGQLHPTARGVS